MGRAQYSRKMRGEKSNKTPGTYRVFDMGRWKEAKLCFVCQKEFTWRKKWSRSWTDVKTCSGKCKELHRKSKNNHLSSQLLKLTNNSTYNTSITGILEK